MAAKLQPKEAAVPDPVEEEKKSWPALGHNLPSTIIERVGRPQGFCRVDVKRLTCHHFRCNILIRDDTMFGLLKLVDSYFIQLNPIGKIVRSEPALEGKY